MSDKRALFGVFGLFVLSVFIWSPALFHHKTIIHGDSIHLSLPLMELQARAIADSGSIFWSSGIYGGHPIFAEGQGGYAHPLNIFLAAVVTPLKGAIYSENALHWIAMFIGGAGVLCLGRVLGIGAAASTFAAIAAMLSPGWIADHHNITPTGTLAWIPWIFVCFEVWLKSPGIKSGVCLGVTCTLAFLAGYPQLLHGAVVYMLCSMLIIPFSKEERETWITERWLRIGSGALAIGIALGLCAVQLLPLLELITRSYRADGIGLLFQIPASPYSFTRVFLAAISSGSALVGLLVSFALLLPMSLRIKGHAIAAFVLIQLGMGETSPLFGLIYDHSLLPGLKYFRITVSYYDVAAIGVTLVAAFALDFSSHCKRTKSAIVTAFFRNFFSLPFPTILKTTSAILIVIGWIFAIRTFNLDWHWSGDLSAIHQAAKSLREEQALAALLVGGAGLLWFRLPKLLPALAIGLLLFELWPAMHSFGFVDASLIAKPREVKAIQALPDWKDYKAYDASRRAEYAFAAPGEPNLPQQMQSALASMSGITATMWDIASLNAVLALPMKRAMIARAIIENEIHGRSGALPGSRLLDILGVRFVSLMGPVKQAAFRPFSFSGTHIAENTAARPRFQFYRRYIWSDSLDEAEHLVESMKQPTLVLERGATGHDDTAQMPEPSLDDIGGNDHFELLQELTTRYDLKVTVERPAWFFFADANYPGWIATVDGKTVPIYSAQILGKAVYLQAGVHRLVFEFRSGTFAVGLWISLISLLATLALIISGERLVDGAGKIVKSLRRVHEKPL